VHRALVEKFGANKLDTLGLTVKTTIDPRLQGMARQAVERGLEELDQRQGYRKPLGHLAGRALEKHRLELSKEHPSLGDADIVDGIVERVEEDAKDPKNGRLFVFVGGNTGVVDTAVEPRYSLGTPPLVARFRPGDLVRVRLAPERKHEGDKDTPLALELGPQAAMVVLDPATRDILALVGGYGYRAGSFDRSQRAQRQPGSAFKPFIYAAAIDSQRFTAASVVNDSPRCTDFGSHRTTTRTTFAVRSGCAPPWPCQSTPWQSSCFPMWALAPPARWPATRASPRRCRIRLSCHWHWVPTQSPRLNWPTLTPRLRPAASTASRA